MTARIAGDSSPVLADHSHPRQPGKNKHMKREGVEKASDTVARPWALTPWPEKTASPPRNGTPAAGLEGAARVLTPTPGSSPFPFFSLPSDLQYF